jgi:hypothetical protein
MSDAGIDKIKPKFDAKPKGRYLFGPIVDFLGLGGAFLVAMILCAPFAKMEISNAFAFIGVTIILSTFINHPHFAHSYQIFYRDFRRKLSAQTQPNLRYRYWFAGIIVPVFMIIYFVLAIINLRADLVGYGAQAMFFLVGWHYVKQGYGMFIVDSVLKKNFLTAMEKKILIWNAYAFWLYTWAKGNRVVREVDYFGLSYYTLDIPDWLYSIVFAAMIAGAILVLVLIVRRLRPGGKGVPFNGAMAYLTSSYGWLLLFSINPLVALFVPAFHSLQYLVVVNRFQLNVETAKIADQHARDGENSKQGNPKERLFRFYLYGMVLGIFAFLAIPFTLVVAKDYQELNLTRFFPLIAVWLFINIHHYFLDNVMWRKGNPEVGKHLYS